MVVLLYMNFLYKIKKETGKESQYIVSRPEPGLDPPIGSDRETGCDNAYLEFLVGRFDDLSYTHLPRV